MRKAFLLVLASAFLLAACSGTSAGNVEVAPRAGALAPPFELNTLQGQPVDLAEYRGQVVMLNFWATWCAPCRFEMPAIQDRFDNTDLQVLAINFDESEDLVQPFVQELELTFPILMDPGAEIQRLYQVRGYPTSVFIDEQGVVQVVHIGILDESQLDGYLQDLGLVN